MVNKGSNSAAVGTVRKRLHHFDNTLRVLETQKNFGAELSTLNPLVVGSNPTGPTKVPQRVDHASGRPFVASGD